MLWVMEDSTKYFYPRSPCGERLHNAGPLQGECMISIHALLAESDSKNAAIGKPTLISIHALLAESDSAAAGKRAGRYYFYPRSPCGERPDIIILDEYQKEISIHALLAESDFAISAHCFDGRISIHALLAESDATNAATTANEALFLSTLSLRRATDIIILDEYQKEISIHALLAESDPAKRMEPSSTYTFLSTLSLRRATLPAGILRR